MAHEKDRPANDAFEREWVRKIKAGIAPSPEDVVLRYAHYLNELDLTAEQEAEFIHTFWSIMQTLVCVRLGIDPVSMARNDKERCAAVRTKDVSRSIVAGESSGSSAKAFNDALQGSEAI